MSAPAQQQVENVAAFARLYGVTRWFYPSDAAATLDWNRFAVEGVRRVRDARSPKELEATLNELFTPLGPGIVIGTTLQTAGGTGDRDPTLVGWHYHGAGITESAPGPYRAKRMNRVPPPRNGAATLPSVISQGIAVDALRGRTIRMRGQVRIVDPMVSGWAGLWLRVDRPGGAVGFFDNMQDRPVRDTTWREYVIEGPIAPDATRIVFGALSVGAMSVDVDAVEVATRDLDGAWTPIPLADASFEAAASSDASGWAWNKTFEVFRPSSGAAHGTQFMRISAPAATPRPRDQPADSLEAPRAGEVIDLELSRGLKARVPLSLSDAQARTKSPGLTTLRAVLSEMAPTIRRDDVDVRLANVVVAWSALRHFYPYWDDIPVDWDDRLRPQLQAAFDAMTTRSAHFDAVRTLVADLRDGHGNVVDVTAPRRWPLPVQLRIVAGRVVVTATSDTTVPVGSVVVAIDGTPTVTRLREELRLASGTIQWREVRAANLLALCPAATTVVVTIELPTGGRSDVRLPCDPSVVRAVEARPDSLAEMEPGIWYVDLTRVRAAELTPFLPTLAAARGVLFDLRGYPTDAGAAVLPHLIRAPEDSTARWMHVSRIAGPFGEVAEWQDLSWNLVPAAPHVTGQRVFLTDGRAISYAESVMGYVRDHAMGTIIGGPTAGANGNVASFSVPGGFTIYFTGMRVTRHDGRTPFHTIGVSPDLALEPTLAGIRAGRDEVLERALVELRARP
ncbi:MAG: S41 family peptidase [Gemmatimonadales bacterium]|nr:S41 family peptidase [Gemmatimonadales bacterium]